MNILWILDIDADYGPRHGGTLRYTQLSRGLIARGHRVKYVVISHPGQNGRKHNEYLETLRGEGCFTDCVEIDEYSVPSITRKLSRLVIHPGVQQSFLASYQVEFKNRIIELLRSGPLTCRLSAIAAASSFFRCYRV